MAAVEEKETSVGNQEENIVFIVGSVALQKEEMLGCRIKRGIYNTEWVWCRHFAGWRVRTHRLCCTEKVRHILR